MTRLKGRTAIVTGAASGIGRAVAARLARDGAQVLCCDIDEDGVSRESAELEAAGCKSLPIALDICSEEQIDRAVDFARSRLGPIDILVNAAGILRHQPVLETTRASFQKVLDVNLLGLFFMSQAVARVMVEQGRGGRIINIASIAGRRGEAIGLQYCASKAAVISVTQSSAMALAEHGILVNAIAPGFIRTPMWDSIHRQTVGDDPQASADFDARVVARVSAGRLGDPGDIAGMAAFLASDDASYIVGQTFNVDGGVVFG